MKLAPHYFFTASSSLGVAAIEPRTTPESVPRPRASFVELGEAAGWSRWEIGGWREEKERLKRLARARQ